VGTQLAKLGREWIIVVVGVHIPRHYIYSCLFPATLTSADLASLSI